MPQDQGLLNRLLENSQLSFYRLPRAVRSLFPMEETAYLVLMDFRDRGFHNYFIHVREDGEEDEEERAGSGGGAQELTPEAIVEKLRCISPASDHTSSCASTVSARSLGRVCVVPSSGGGPYQRKQDLSGKHYPEFFMQVVGLLAGERSGDYGACPHISHFTGRLRELGYDKPPWKLEDSLKALEKIQNLDDAEAFHHIVRTYTAFPYIPSDGLQGILWKNSRNNFRNEKWVWLDVLYDNVRFFFLAFPILDMGSLQGFLFIKQNGDLDAEAIRPQVDQVPMMVRSAREADFLHIPLEPGLDPVEHLVRYLPTVQSWKRVQVWRDSQCLYEYSYCRNPAVPTDFELYQWQRQGGKDAAGQADLSLKLSEVLDPRIIPGCTDEDRERFGDLELRCFLHEDDRSHYCKGDHAPERIRQIVRLLAVLLERHRVYRHSLRSAVAAIMARNMSHNIDSHVTPRATVEAVRQRLGGLGFSQKYELEVIQVLKGRLDKYRQQRADFLAEVTSEPLTTTKPACFYQDVIMPLVENVLLMDNIARNEGICYTNQTTNRLRIRVFIGDNELKAIYRCATTQGLNGTAPYQATYSAGGFPYSAHCINCNWQSGTEDHSQTPSLLVGEQPGRDVEIELPGPVGEHAFYGFLENLIRNVAKHNRQHFDNNPQENLEINIRISEPNDDQERKDFYVVEIWDNVTDPNKSVNTKIKVNGEERECGTLYDLIKAYIDSEVIDETGKRKEQAYGITEMKVDATLLRGSTDFMRMKEFLEVRKEQKRATNWVNKSHQEIEKERLVYRFRLMKAKKMCGVFPNWQDDKLQASLQNEGIWIFKTVKELKQAIVPGETSDGDFPRSAASFRFAVFDCSGTNGQEIANQIQELLPYSPFRILVLADNNTTLSLPKAAHIVYGGAWNSMPQNADEIMVWLWKHWLKRWRDSTKILELYFDQKQNESPTQEWSSYAGQFNGANTSQGYHIRVWSRNGPSAGQSNIQGVHIVFDRHGGLVGPAGWFNQYRVNTDFGRRDMHTVLDKLSPDFSPIFRVPPSSGTNWTFPYELIEAGLLRVLVVDERVAEKAVDQVGVDGYLRRWLLSFRSKIYICTHFGVNRNPEPLHKAVERMVETYLKVFFENNSLNYQWKYQWGEIVEGNTLDVDMVIIHQGILDHEKDIDPKFDAESFLMNLQKHIPFVIVNSGRGIPPALPKQAKFLPFSILSDYILGQRIAKYRLTQVTMSLTRKGGKGP